MEKIICDINNKLNKNESYNSKDNIKNIDEFCMKI